jgi:hypothetical protein
MVSIGSRKGGELVLVNGAWTLQSFDSENTEEQLGSRLTGKSKRPRRQPSGCAKASTTPRPSAVRAGRGGENAPAEEAFTHDELAVMLRAEASLAGRNIVMLRNPLLLPVYSNQLRTHGGRVRRGRHPPVTGEPDDAVSPQPQTHSGFADMRCTLSGRAQREFQFGI